MSASASGTNHFHVLAHVPEKALREGAEDAVAVRAQLLARMHDLSEFMKTLKQRFSIWYNRNHDGRLGTLWTCRGKLIDRETAGRILNEEKGELPLSVVLRCRGRYFTDGAVLGSAEFVRRYAGAWQSGCGRKFPVEANPARGGAWGDLAVINAIRRAVFD